MEFQPNGIKTTALHSYILIRIKVAYLFYLATKFFAQKKFNFLTII